MVQARHGNKAKSHFLRNCDLPSLLEPSDLSKAFNATKLIFTVGPGCQDVDTLCRLLKAGATVARCDLTWGPLEFHQKSLENLNEAMKRTRKLCATMIDTTGRELVIKRPAKLDDMGWPTHDSEINIAMGQQVTITTRDVPASNTTLPIEYNKFCAMVQPGDSIFLGRYLVTGADSSSLFMEVQEVTKTDVVCLAKNNAVLDGLLTVFHTERSADSLSNVQNDLPVLSPVDEAALKALSKDFELDFVSLSFTRSGEDVEVARDFLDSLGLNTTKLIAKCETRQSLFNFKAIAAASDGIIMSRGNLGLDVLPEKMALIQKAMISNCNIMGKPCLLTRVVDTMIDAPRPTRAEATDVANAVLDGADGIMLGAETLRGKYPVETVETVLHICKQAEKVFDHNHHFEHLMQEQMEAEGLDREGGIDRSASSMSLQSADRVSLDGMAGGSYPSHGMLGLGVDGGLQDSTYFARLESIASSAVRAADKVNAALIIAFTHTGRTASLLSKYRPPMPILTLVVPSLKSDTLSWRLEGRHVARQCQIERGLLPLLAAPSPSGETLLEEAVLMSARVGLVKAHDHIVVVQRIHESFVVKIVSVDDMGTGIAPIRPKSLMDMMKAMAGLTEDDAAVVNDLINPTPGQGFTLGGHAMGDFARSLSDRNARGDFARCLSERDSRF